MKTRVRRSLMSRLRKKVFRKMYTKIRKRLTNTHNKPKLNNQIYRCVFTKARVRPEFYVCFSDKKPSLSGKQLVCMFVSNLTFFNGAETGVRRQLIFCIVTCIRRCLYQANILRKFVQTFVILKKKKYSGQNIGYNLKVCNRAVR